MADNIDSQLKILREARQKLESQLTDTCAALSEIEAKIQHWNARQEARLRADDRLDNKMVDKVTQSTSTKEKADRQLGDQSKPEDSKTQLVPNNLTADDVSVKPRKDC